MVRQTGIVQFLVMPSGEGGEDSAMDRPAPRRGGHVDRGQTRELVAERDAALVDRDETRRQAVLDPVEAVPGDRVEEPGLGTRRHEGDRLEQVEGRAVEARTAREDGVSDCRGHPGVARGEDLGDEERIAFGRPVQLVRVDVVPQCELSDRVARQWWEREPIDGGRGREVAEQDLHRVRARQPVVAEGGNHERRHVLDPPGEETQHVERRLVPPMEVLQHQDGRLLAQPRVKGTEHIRRRGADAHELGELAVPFDDVEERAEWARRREWVARADEDARPVVHRVAKSARERGLAGTRFARDEHHPAAPDARVAERLEQRRELLVPFEEATAGLRGVDFQTHGLILNPVMVRRKSSELRSAERTSEGACGDGHRRGEPESRSADRRGREGACPLLVVGAEPDRPDPGRRSRGRHFWDYEGKRYLDFASQLVNVYIGHQHPKIIQAIKDQADQLCTIGPPLASESRSTLGRMLAEVTPGDLSVSFFTNGGAEANENAVKLARLVTGRHKIIARYRSYHGATNGADHPHRRPTPLGGRAGMPGVVRMFDPYTYRCPAGHPDPCPVCTGAPHLEEILEYEGAHTVAGGDPRDGDGDERRHPAARRLPPGDPRGVRPPRHPADPRRGDGRLRAHGPLVCVRPLGRRPRHPHGRQGDQLRVRAARRDDRAWRGHGRDPRSVLPRRADLRGPSARVRLGRRLDRGLPRGGRRRERRRVGEGSGMP